MPRKVRSNRPKPGLSGFMKSFAETNKYQTVLLGDIQKYVLTRADEDRDPHVVHPSEMAKPDWCPRSTAYRIRDIPPSNLDKDTANIRLQTIFQEGHDIHSKWQTWLAEMGLLFGLWECRNCEATFLGESLTTCNKCGMRGLKYKEVPLLDESRMIAGNSDGGVMTKDALIEIKSIGVGTVRIEDPALLRQYQVKTVEGRTVVDLEQLWKGIKRPLKSHRFQGWIYLYLAEVMELPVDKMVFIYENKANQGTKEFVIKRNNEAIEDLLEMAADVKWAVDNETLPPRPNGFTKESKPCKTCVFRDLCWEGRDQARAGQPQTTGRRSVVRSRRTLAPAEDPASRASGGRRVPRTAGRPHRSARQRPDEPVRGDDPVVRLPGRSTGDGRGRREVRRRSTR